MTVKTSVFVICVSLTEAIIFCYYIIYMTVPLNHTAFIKEQYLLENLCMCKNEVHV